MGKLTALYTILSPKTVLTNSSLHTDIKPDNILFVEDRLIPTSSSNVGDFSKLEEDQNKFKLADPGFAKFVKKSPKESNDVPRQHLEGGTWTYGWCCSTVHCS